MEKNGVDSSAYVPLYIQVYHLLRDSIEAGDYKAGDRLPSENELIEKYSISRTTAIAAIEELVKTRLVYREQGRGTFVAKSVVNDFSFHKSFTEDMRARGVKPGSRLLSLQVCSPQPEIINKLKIPTDEDFYCLIRVRLADDEPVALQYAYLPIKRVPGLLEQDFENKHLFEILRNVYQIKPAWAEAVVEAASVDQDEAKLLGITANTPVLVVWHLTLDDKYKPVEYVRSVYRSDRFSFATGRSPIRTP